MAVRYFLEIAVPSEEKNQTSSASAGPAARPIEKDYRAAMAAARMGAWETNLVEGTRKWSPEAMNLFGFNLPSGIGEVGGESDEYLAALHPDDRHLMGHFHKIANVQDFYEGDYRIVRPGSHVRCAVTGVPIPLDELKYWNVELQEAYAGPEAVLRRFHAERVKS